MKKIIALLTCLALSAACLIGCTNNNEAFTQKGYSSDKEQITDVSIDVSDREIEVMLSTDSQIHIDYFESSKEYYDISVDNHTLTMTAATDKEWTDYVGLKPDSGFRKITLQVPDILLSTLKLSTTNENITLAALTVTDSASLLSNGGNIVFDKLNAGNSIDLNAKNGNISGTIIGSYEDYSISCDIKKGESNLPSTKDTGTKTLTAKNNNGDIDIEFIQE